MINLLNIFSKILNHNIDNEIKEICNKNNDLIYDINSKNQIFSLNQNNNKIEKIFKNFKKVLFFCFDIDQNSVELILSKIKKVN